MQFWLDVIDEWQRETGQNALVALSCTKDVQDAILADPKRSAIVDIIDIRYWHYKTDGLYAPQGGLNLAPRQHARIMKVGKVTFDEAYKAVNEYRTKYPEKAVTYFTENYPEMAWAVLMAGGSCPQLPVKNPDFLKAMTGMQVQMVKSGTYYQLVNSGKGTLIYAEKSQTIPVQLETGNYRLTFIDCRTGEEKIVSKKIKGNQIYKLKITDNQSGAWWFSKI